MMLAVFFGLLCGHAVADFALQPDAMAHGKNRHNRGEVPPGATYTPCWAYWLTAHSLTHGTAVWLITGVWWLGLAETAVHWCIDFAKCENWTGVHADQALHVACKVAWVVILVGMTS